jgi:multidrug efflux pump subunit AcrA (membrane-fusion protein)
VLSAIPETYDAVGTIRSRRQAVLSARIVAPVVAVHANEGDRVTTGQLLIELDDREVKSLLARAEAELLAAREGLDEAEAGIQAAEKTVKSAQSSRELVSLTFRRHQALLEKRSVTQQEYDEARARLVAADAEVERSVAVLASVKARKRQAQAKIEQAEAGLVTARTVEGYPRITAPIDGIVASRTAEVGNLASPGVALMAIDQTSYRVEANVQESEIRHITLGQLVRIRVEALGKEVDGPVSQLVPAADPQSRTSVVKIDLPQMPGLHSGLYAEARFSVGERKAIVVPRSAVVDRGQLETVMAVDGERVARMRLIKTGRETSAGVEVLSGLTEGDQYIVSGADKVADPSRLEGAQ